MLGMQDASRDCEVSTNIRGADEALRVAEGRGFIARSFGADRDACPYPAGRFADAWVRGWARRDAIAA